MLTPYQFASNTPIWGVDIDGEEVRIYTESGNYTRLQVGHTFISLGDASDILVYTYGRYGELGKDKGSFNPTNLGGEGVLIQLKGQEAKDFIGKYIHDYGASVYEFMDADENLTKSFFDSQFNGSSIIPKSGPYKNEENARVVDNYDLKCNNCTTKSLEGIKSGTGSDVLYNLRTSHPKSKSGNIPVRSVLTPLGLDKDLRNAVKNPKNNIRDVTEAMKENYPSPSKEKIYNDSNK